MSQFQFRLGRSGARSAGVVLTVCAMCLAAALPAAAEDGGGTQGGSGSTTISGVGTYSGSASVLQVRGTGTYYRGGVAAGWQK